MGQPDMPGLTRPMAAAFGRGVQEDGAGQRKAGAEEAAASH
jgi:hypothetical protein